MSRTVLYLACYDVSEDRRLSEALAILRDYAVGRQQSVFECPLASGEPRELVNRIAEVLDNETDRFALIRLDPRARMHAIGRAEPVQSGPLFFVG